MSAVSLLLTSTRLAFVIRLTSGKLMRLASPNRQLREKDVNFTTGLLHHIKFFESWAVATLWVALLLVSAPSQSQMVSWRDAKDAVDGGIVRVHVVYEKKERIKPYQEGQLEHRTGTGFFINDSVLVTNQHVVEGARSIKIEGANTREKFSARLAARSSLHFDLAVLKFAHPEEKDRFEKVNGDITPLEWADWSHARPGEQVAVIGFGNSDKLVATQGIVSSWEAHRDIFQNRLDHVTLIRTDAAVNPGNSGGPAISASGQVVGISARYGPGENVGLLIPFVTAKRVVDTMLRDGEFVKTNPGIVTYVVNPVVRQALNMPFDQAGLVISHVSPNSPASRSGLRKWDLITKVNGKTINHGEIDYDPIGRLPYWFAYNTGTVGETVRFEVFRDGRKRDVTLTLEEANRPRTWIPTAGEDYEPQWGILGGLVISEVTRELLEQLEASGSWRWDLVNDAPPGGKIYIVTNVEPNTQAASYIEYGLDLYQHRVISINGRPLVGDLREYLQDIYQSIVEGSAPDVISVEFENHLSIPLITAQLKNDQFALSSRYPTLPLWSTYRSESDNDRSEPAALNVAPAHRPDSRHECVPEPNTLPPENIDPTPIQ